MRYSNDDKAINESVYQHFMEMGIYDGWPSEDKLENFELFLTIAELTHFPIHKSSILDVGSGTGDFAYFISQHKARQYLGIEIIEKVVRIAEEKYPQFDFLVGDFLALDLPLFDFVYASGAMTTKLSTNNYHILEKWLKKMWAVSKKGFVFNCLLERYPGDKSDEGLFLYTRQKVLEIAAGVSREAEMKALTTDAGCGDGTEELHLYLYRR